MAVNKRIKKARIRFSTQIIKRLGEELNPSVDQSILELVKNSYDADALNCTVVLDNITEIGGSIKIVDDGKGMTDKEIINGWLVLGESTKSISKKTSLGRIPAGSKGLGRLAALRMGHVAILKSTPKVRIPSTYDLNINWDKFDKAKLVNDVTLNVESRKKLSTIPFGTSIEIKNLKHKIGIREVKKIARGLILLADPFGDDPNAFKPVLKAKEFKEMEELVSKRYFDDAEYHLVASVDAKGQAEATVQDYLGNILFKTTHKQLSEKRKGEKYDCPAVTFDLWAYILNATTFQTRATSVSEIQEWLAEVGGVHLYENGLRVNPYGNPGNDWLDMNLARTRSPEERPSTNTAIGIVRVKDSKGLLSQKTDRSGFIENDVFHEIRAFCQDALEWMAKRRLEVAERKRRNERQRTSTESENTKADVAAAIKKLPAAKRKVFELAFAKYDKARIEEVKSLKNEVQLYRTLSTAGITVATFSHESNGNPIKVITQAIGAIDRRIKKQFDSHYSRFAEPISSITKSVDALKVLASATLKLLAHEKRRAGRVEIHKVIKNVVKTFMPFFEGRDIEVSTDLANANPYLRATEAAIESIITNLLNNSINALENTNSQRKILIKSIVQENILSVSVSDNGPGIVGITLKNIWLPGYTTNPNGTGLGLTIVRDATSDLGGKVRAVPNGDLGGADIIVELPIIGI